MERFQHWIGLNTLLIDIKPHAMIINRLRMDLYLFDTEGLQWILPQNSVAIPSNIHVSKNSFHFVLSIHLFSLINIINEFIYTYQYILNLSY